MTSEKPKTIAERRAKTRITVALPVQVFNPDGNLLLQARTVDLSTGGALVHGTCHISPGDDVSLEIDRGPNLNPLRLKAVVVRHNTPSSHRRQHGLALHFEDIDPLDERVLRAIIDNAIN